MARKQFQQAKTGIEALKSMDADKYLKKVGLGRDDMFFWKQVENWLICMSGREFPYPGDREAIEDFVAKGGMVGTRIGPKGIVESEGEADNYQKEMEKKMFDEEAQINLGTKSPLY
ncbi:hypothetical protein Bca52824_057332 [Brassica carinata]|uniref:Uncharacterized protein n=1 Tax=Brassica carinata TaxID=52824 RepID=A0A8X7QR09_BRACI|nr:hypothetical protein Bca52824_057332 [Brassica carinata]